MLSALATIGFNILDIRETMSLFDHTFDWKWWTLGSFLVFLSFVMWWIIGLESSVRQNKNARPNLVFIEYRETPLFENGKPIYHGLQAWFVNKPKTPTKDSIAEDVTARITFYNRTTHEKLSVYGLWVIAEAFDFAGYKEANNMISKISPNAEPCKLAIAVKWQDDESAYAFVVESHLYSKTGDFRESVREIKTGIHYVKVEFNGVGISQEPYWFNLNNPGVGKELLLSAPIKKPNLRKEGFQS